MTKCHEHFNHSDYRSGLHPRISGNSHTFSTDYHHSLNLILKPGVDLATAGDVDGQANPTLCARCRGSGELLLKITIMMIILMTMARASWLLPFEERVVILNICQVTRTFPTPIDRWALTEAQSAVEKVFWQHHSSRHLDHHLVIICHPCQCHFRINTSVMTTMPQGRKKSCRVLPVERVHPILAKEVLQNRVDDQVAPGVL